MLIVGNDEQFSRFLVDALSELDEAVTTQVAHFRSEASQKIHTFVPHIVLLDFMMPGVDVFAVCRQIEEDPSTIGVDVISITRFHIQENADRIISVSAPACLGRPVDPDMLTRDMGVRLERAEA